MDFLKQLIGDRASQLTASLAGEGFSAEQAQRFLPEAGESVKTAIVNSGGLDLNSDQDSMISSLLNKIDIGALAGRTGLNASLVTKGLGSILPTLLSAVKDKLGSGGDLLALLAGGGDASNMLGKLKSFF